MKRRKISEGVRMEKNIHRPKPSPATTRMRRDICDFARDHKLIIHPAGYDYYIWAYFQGGHCPCDKTRPVCPCNEALVEVAQVGHCRCNLFWRSLDDFKDSMLHEKKEGKPN